MPDQKEQRFIEQYKLKPENAKIITRSKDLADYFENVCSELESWMKAEGEKFSQEGREKLYRLAANYILTEFQKHLFDNGQKISDAKVTAENFAEFIKMVYRSEINSSAAQMVLKEMFATGADPSNIVEEKNLAQSSDEGELKKVVKKVAKNNPDSVKDYKNGKGNAIQFLMGQVMRETKGKANPKVATKLLEEELK